MKVDLHLHTTASDGEYSPLDLLKNAEEKNFDVISITDHDTVDGYRSILPFLNQFKVRVIPGVEISINYEDKEFHLLGYGIDIDYPPLATILKANDENRAKRALAIVRKLNKRGMALRISDVEAQAGAQNLLGRPHIARALVAKGFLSSVKEAFDHYIGDNGPCYEPKQTVEPWKIIEAVKEAGGIPVLAHPFKIGNDKYISRFAKWGIQGLEVYYLKHSQDQIEHYIQLASSLSLICTGGSDFHCDDPNGAYVLGSYVVNPQAWLQLEPFLRS